MCPTPRIRCDLLRLLRGLFCLLVLSLGLLAGVGCSKKPRMDPKEAAALEALKTYEPTHEVDKQLRVTEIKLEGAWVDDDALDQIKDFPALKTLSLYSASITDAGLAKLVGNKRIEALGLVQTRITDQGVKYLEKMPSLRWIWVSKNNPKLTKKRLDELTKALPGLTVYQD
jgi:hypothetical protein